MQEVIHLSEFSVLIARVGQIQKDAWEGDKKTCVYRRGGEPAGLILYFSLSPRNS